METQQQAKIHGAICAIMTEVGGVGKNRTNPSQGYRFRGIADLYLACQPLMAKHGVHVTPVQICDQQMQLGKTSKGGDSYHVTMRVRYRAFASDGSFVEIETMGEAIDTSDKASNKAMSAAMKYALIQLFAIPEEDPEADTESASPEQRTGDTGKAQSKPAEKPAETKQGPVALLITILKSKGEDTKEKALGWMSRQLKREVKATKDLKPAEVDQLTKLANAIPAPTTGPQE